MIDRQLAQCLDPVAARIRQFWMGLSLGIVWLSAAVVGAILLWKPAEGFKPQTLAWWLMVAAVAVAGVSAWIIWSFAKNYSHLARRIEAAYPDLGASLITALEQKPNSKGSYGYLQQEVLRRAYLHSYQQPWNKVMPQSRLMTVRIANFLGILAFAAVLFGLFSSESILPTVSETLAFDDVKVMENPDYALTVEPGAAEVERGGSLLVMARFQGPLPPDATLVYQPQNGEERRLAMSKSLKDPVFGSRILSVNEPLTYRVEFAEQTSDFYGVTVFEYPRLKQADARLKYPSYTHLEEKLLQDVRRISVVQGTKVTLLCRLNKSVAEAKLIEEKHDIPLNLTANADEPLVYEVSFPVDRSQRLKLHLTDAEGRTNQNPPEFVINALPNRPPDLKLAFPARDVQVSPVEELDVKATAWDDYGLTRVGLSFAPAGKPIQDVALGEMLPAKERVPLEHLLSFEAMNAEPDQLVSYFFWAEDIGPDGEVRRTSSDMYFAEVRHFEEIFRQGQQPTEEQMRQQQQQQQNQQGSQNAQEAERLAELQKQIINGTWKVIRRETRDQPTAKFAEDGQLLLESQLSALEQATALKDKLQDEQSLVHVDQVRQHMQQAIGELQQAVDGPTINALQPALASEQSAYQALLKLRAREHEVVRSNQQQQSQSQSQSARQSANSRAQQQLQQLQLREEENRYETERQANSLQSPQAQEQREDRQVLNRLRELSQRQNDLNERIKELQSALEEAKTQEDREEIERRLKRLQDEQQQILRDTEELQQRMEQPENQERMANEREQLQQARESARQSSEALQEGQVSRAAAEGTRTEREFRELQDEFQRRTSNQFTEAMREMQQQARELEQKEQELANQLADADRPKPDEKPSLGEDNEQKNVEDEIQKQRERIENLLDRMRKTVEEAEGAEPLLAEQLYDTIRNTRRQNPEDALENAERSFRRGLIEDAQNQEKRAQAGITQIREGIEKAAESVLGDETEALRRAREQLERLNRDLQNEIARNQPDGQRQPGEEPNEDRQPGEQQPNGQQPNGQQPNGQRQPGQQPNGQQPNGQRQPGQQPNGQQPNGQRQPGQRRRGGLRSGGDDRNLGSANRGGLEQFLEGRDNRNIAPLSGEDFLDWSDRLRDVEEMLSDPKLRAEAARIRDRAKAIRKDVKRHSKSPNWDIVKDRVSEPLVELQNRVATELLRRTSKDALVPIDRDPVPPKYEARVRKYYERLGAGK